MNLFFSLLLTGCNPETSSKNQDIDGQLLIDADGDGFISAEDCDDASSTINPAASEICDGIDNNCDGQVDEGVTTVFYGDADVDGFGNPQLVVQACEAPDGYVANGSDCDDTNPNSHPSAEEFCDQQDNDCDGIIDNGLMETYFIDHDNDGFGDQETEACTLVQGLSHLDGDCDDNNPDIHPAAEEICDQLDNNCDTQIDEDVLQVWYPDVDEDGYGDDNAPVQACEAPAGYVAVAGDCDDVESFVHPLRIEFCDGLDNDCDGETDETGAIGEITVYLDADGDGYGDAANAMSACQPSAGYVDNAEDCNDAEITVFPGATEYCNNADDDCNGLIDESTAVDQTTWNIDYDSDGHGSSAYQLTSCQQPTGYVQSSDDCDDTNGMISPSSTEICDGLDNDCDSLIDTDDGSLDSTTLSVFYPDLDQDGYGELASPLSACTAPLNHVETGGDCDDSNPAVSPDASEICDGLDNDCNSLIDQDDSNLDTATLTTYFADTDNDGYGDSSASMAACTLSNGYADNDLDCHDGDSSINPSANEICDQVDNDCDTFIDQDDSDFDTSSLLTYFVDSDGDGYGDDSLALQACDIPADGSAVGGDCDDDDPDSTIIADDADCDGVESADDCDDADATIFLGSDSSCPADSCEDLINLGAADGLYWLNLHGTPTEAYCDMTTNGGGWLQCAGWQSMKDDDFGAGAYYPRDMFVTPYNDRATADGLNDAYWSIDCADFFNAVGATSLMFHNTNGSYWSFELPIGMVNIDNFYQKDTINVGTLSDDPPVNIQTNTGAEDIRVDFDGNCSYGTGAHEWKVLSLPGESCSTSTSVGISYRHLSNVYGNCVGNQNCTNYSQHVTCGNNQKGTDCENQWTYLLLK